MEAVKRPFWKNRVVRRAVIALLTLYVIGLAWGYVRLPWAAVRNLTDFRLIAQAPAVTYASLDVSDLQRSYLEQKLPRSNEPANRQVEISVKWYAVAFARVQSGYSVSPTGAEWKDALYLCCFGTWVPIYTFSHVMA